MTPDTTEGRVQRLEREMASLQTQVVGLSHEVETLAPVQMSVVRIETTMEQVNKDLTALGVSIREDRIAAQKRGTELAKELSDMREAQAEDQKASRKQLIASAASIITTLLLVGGSVVGAVLASS